MIELLTVMLYLIIRINKDLGHVEKILKGKNNG